MTESEVRDEFIERQAFLTPHVSLHARITPAKEIVTDQPGDVMTRFFRKGHHRNSSQGITHWVNGTTVERNDWDRYTPTRTAPRKIQSATEVDNFYKKYPNFQKNFCRTSCYVIPNASCPVCGESVFYYRNDNGSSVFFDEIGPPWPKHPCTDNLSSPMEKALGNSLFNPRPKMDIAEISQWSLRTRVFPDQSFESKYGKKPWPLATVAKRIKGKKSIHIILVPIETNGQRLVYLRCNSLPRCCKEKTIVAFKSGEISFFDTTSMTAKKVIVERIRNASRFIESIIR